MLRAMKRILKVLAYLAGTAAFLLATAHFTLRHQLNTPKFKGALTGFIERAIGRTTDYERVDYTLFPFSLVVRNAVIREKGDAQEFASIRGFSAAIDFRAREITSLRLDRPALRIVQRADGTFNFSDLISKPVGKDSAPGPAPKKPSGPGRPAPEGQPSPAAPPFSIRQVQIEKARFEFVRQRADQTEESFTLSDLNVDLRDFAPDQPVQVNGQVAIGGKSSFRFALSGPPPAKYADRPGAWPAAFSARLDLADFADVQAFLPAGTRPFQSLAATLEIHGALTDRLSIQMKLQTPPEATEDFPVALEADLQAALSLPAPVAAHLLNGSSLPEPLRVSTPPCPPPLGAMALTAPPELALLLRHLQATAEWTFPKIAYGRNVFGQGAATASLQNGVLVMPGAKCSAYGGALEARGNIQLLACPLAYRLDRLVAKDLALEQVLAANGFGEVAGLSGRVQLEGSAAGQAVAEPGLRSGLAADARLRIDALQTAGPGGSLMDRVWLQLDHPLLRQLMPRLKTKIEQAESNAGNVTTTRYDEATATLSLRDGRAALSDARLSRPDGRLHAAGDLFPFDDRLDLSARLVASPAETARLTDGKDLSAYLPYEDGGLMVPLTLRGSLRKPDVRPDLDRLLHNALAGVAGGESGNPLEHLSDSDRKNVETGLQILGDWLAR